MMTRPITRVAVPLAVLLSISLPVGSASATAGKGVTAKECPDVVVKFEPEGSGGAHNIRASEIGCDRAREVARSCIKGEVVEGWQAVTWTRTLLTKGEKRISYLPVGGGGCGALPEDCSDFFYRGVGFFNVRVLAWPCRGEEGAPVIARKWYDKDGCGFGETCRVAGFRCRGNTRNGRVMCIRHDHGNRVTWEMGE